MEPLRFGGRADAYLEWGMYTGFADYVTVQEREESKHIGLLVQWRSGLGQNPLEHPPAAIKCASVYRDFRHAAISVDAAWLMTPAAEVFFRQAQRIELASPVSPMRVPGREGPVPMQEGIVAKDGVLLGCIDDGFPLANTAMFNGGNNRIARFWNQNDGAMVVGKSPGSTPNDPWGTNFSYGKELVNAIPTPYGLPTPANGADESAYYESVRMTQMRRRATHGAHVLDLMAGPVAARGRFPWSRDLHGGGDGSSSTLPESVPPGVAARAPVVLVQLPKYAIEDPSGSWLGRNVLDGLHYILQAAGTSKKPNPRIKNIIVNVSWGPQTGPRDGSSLLEQAMDELVARQKGRQLDIVLAAGNSRNLRAHAEFTARRGCKDLVWAIPPGLESPSQLEVWWPATVDARHASITVTSPDGVVVSSRGEGIWPQLSGSAKEWGVTQVRCGNRMTALLTLSPTFFRDGSGAAAPHGRWLISVDGAPVRGRVHVNVARTSHNMGAGRRSRSSHLWDPVYEEFRHSRLGRNEPPPAKSLVQSSSTLSGVATGSKTRVATGYRLADAAPSTYASEGPCTVRKGPDLSYPTDESGLMVGIKAGAVRSGTVVRLAGTSAAAPQFVRDIADLGPIADPVGPPHPRLGMGRR